MNGHRRPVARALVVLSLVVALPAAGRAQDPVVKPTPTTSTTTGRLPLPRNVAARQLADGRIELRWSPVTGADGYQVTRSIAGGAQGVVADAFVDTVYLDADVVAGRTYYYLVAALSSAGIGLKAGTTPVTATRSAGTTTGGTTAPTTGPAPVVVRPYGTSLVVEWAAAGDAASYNVARYEYRAAADDSTRMDPATRRLVSDVRLSAGAPRQVRDTASPASQPRWIQYQVSANPPIGSPRSALSVIVPIAASTTSGGGTSVSTSTVAWATAVPGTPVALPVGASLSLPSRTAISGARWLSLHPAIADVSADGAVTARAAGAATILAIATQADGSARVAAFRVDVTP